MQVIFQDTVNTSVFEEVVQNTVKYSILHTWCCKNRANSGVLATLAFLVLQKHRKYRCFGSILGLREKENIVSSVVLSLVGAENMVNYDVLSAFRNRSFRT